MSRDAGETGGQKAAPARRDGETPLRSKVHLRLRAELIDAVRDVIQQRGLRQREAAELFGVAQPRVSDLVRGKLELFSIDTLVSMLAAAGVGVELRLHPASQADRAGSRRPRRSSSSSTR